MSLINEIIPLPNADKDGFKDYWYPGRNFGDLLHPFKMVTAGPPNSGKTTAIVNVFLRIQLSPKCFENLIVIQPETSHEFDMLDPTVILNDFPAPEDLVTGGDDEMVKTCVIIDDFDLSKLTKTQQVNVSKLFRYLSSHNNISLFCSYQSFFSIPIIIRSCATQFLIYKPRNSDELSTIAKRVGIKKDMMHNIFDREIKKKQDCLLIDLTCPEEYFIRKNIFQPLNIEDYKTMKLSRVYKNKIE